MTIVQALLAYVLAAGLLTITPGLDTALILRTAAAEGPRRAVLATAGICTGCLVWGLGVAVGLGTLLAASALAFTILKFAGAAYLVWLGLGLLLKPRDSFELTGRTGAGGSAYRKGVLTNLLNPKIGVFYVSFLPQFLPQGVPAGPFLFGLAALHAVIGAAWAGVLIAATRPVAGALQKAAVVRWLDRVTGGVFLLFAAKLAFERR